MKRIALLLLLPAFVWAAPKVEQSDTSLNITLSSGMSLQFALENGVLLGLQQAQLNGVSFSSSDTVLFPLVAEEYVEDRRIWPLLKFEKAVADGEAVELHTRLLGSSAEQAFRSLFVFTGDKGKALASDLPPELQSQREKSNRAKAELEARVDASPEWQKRMARKKELEAKGNLGGRERKELRNLTSEKRSKRDRDNLRKAVIARDSTAKALNEEAKKFGRLLGPYALENYGKIHRDFYEFAHFRQPADISRLSERKALLSLGDWQEEGTLIWRVEPATHTVAGWPWQGWRMSYRVQLPQGRKVNSIRQLGTWEIDGTAAGNTLIALRYRGLGRIEQAFTAGDGGGIREAYTSTETMPGAVGGAPLVSPVVPTSENVNDRGYALRHRVGAWICRLARGGGANFVDFQFRPHAGFASFHERQGNLRGLSEAFPEDQTISFTDEQIFALSNTYTSEPQVFVGLVNTDQPFGRNDWQTRWHEVDQYVRDMVSEELGFVQIETVPGIGILYENGRPGAFRGLGRGGAAKLKEQGVRIVVNHAPGWYSAQHRNGWDQPRTGGGNSNQIWDWHPTKDVQEPWQEMSRALAKEGIAYFAYMTGMSAKEKEFYNEVGGDLTHWGVNKPGNDFSSGYPPRLMGHNPLNERFRSIFVPKIEATQDTYGFQGIWADSFQNMYMSQLNWGEGEGNSNQRTWWEIIAKWSRRGINWMSESQGFPGWSCSIEVQHWEKDTLYFAHVWKWLRGTSQNAYSGEKLDELTFRVMSVKGWLGPDRSYSLGQPVATPSFKRLADEYMAALPGMRRPYILPKDAGILWLPYDGKSEGMLFAYQNLTLPNGVSGAPVLGGEMNGVQAFHVYRVKAADLQNAFQVRVAPEADHRASKTYTPTSWTWLK